MIHQFFKVGRDLASMGDGTCLMHTSWMNHPAIRAGQKFPKPVHHRMKQAAPLEAFIGLTGEPAVERKFHLHPNVPLTLDLRQCEHPIPNVMAEWNWDRKGTKAFLERLQDFNLITALLGASLIEMLPRPKSSDRVSLSKAVRETVWAKTSGKCVYCAVVLTWQPGFPHSFHADHVLPAIRGGSDDVANLVPACLRCNLKKKAGTALQFIGGRDE